MRVRRLALVMLGMAVAAPALATDRVIIGTAGLTGVYYAAGGAICRLVNDNRKSHGVRCSADSSAGSMDNMGAMLSDEFNMGLVQGEIFHDVSTGALKVGGKPVSDRILSVMALHPEALTIVTRPGSGVNSFADLAGKVIASGPPGSGTAEAVNYLLRAKGLQPSHFRRVLELDQESRSDSVCDGTAAAGFFAIGHPNGAVQETVTICRATLVALSKADIDATLQQNAGLRAISIPAGTYRTSRQEVTTFGAYTLLVARESVSPAAVHAVAKSVIDNLNTFKGLHPALGRLNERDMFENAFPANLHPGAARYFKEKGLM